MSSGAPRRGTVRQLAPKKHEHSTREANCLSSSSRRVLRLVQRPGHANHHSTLVGIPIKGDAFEVASRSGKPVKTGGTGTGVKSNRALHGSPRFTASAKEEGVTRRQGRRSRPSSLRGHERSGLVARMSKLQLQNSVGGVWSQIRSANALSKRAVRVE
jgi:hypothetical protein